MGHPGKHAVRALALALVIATAGCGPIGYVSQVTRTASTSVEEARALNAAKYAPYWWTRAVEYLHKAREEAAHADFQAANRFGRLAAEAAEHAKADAIRRAADPKLMEEITPPPPLPARGKPGLAPAVDGDAAPGGEP
ncbi:MAG TPA: hypothetical protein VM734_08025 [Kofleriaceae bacterium]|jgi:hypothetical protein|nr:hypothetical protein [Kofleriaceae bacterium]